MTTVAEPSKALRFQDVVTRQELYELAWQVPMLRVAERFGVSSSYLARVFTELRVPRPSPGYWSKREFGKAPPKPPLPAARPGDLVEWSPGISVGSVVRAVAKASREAKAIAADRPDSPRVKAQAKASLPSASNDDQSAGVVKRHELLSGVKPLFLKSRDTDNGILRPFKRLLVDVMASAEKLDDALEVAQVLFETLNRRGIHVGFTRVAEQMSRAEVDLLDKPVGRSHHRAVWGPERPTVAYIGGAAIGLTIFEMTEEVEVVYVSGKYLHVRDLSEQQLRRYTGPHHWRHKKEHASGRFCLQAYCPFWMVKWSKRWQESKPGTFQKMVPGIVRELETAAPELAQKVVDAKLRAEEERRKWDEERRQRQVEAERLQREKAIQMSRQDLRSAIATWDEARRIHDYFEAVEADMSRLPEPQAAIVRDRLQRGRQLVGALDPIAQLINWRAPDELLRGPT